jgi:hypothetical protein
MILSAAFCLTGTSVMAEETASSMEAVAEENGQEETEADSDVPEYYWSDLEDQVEKLGYSGDFYAYNALGFRMWIPDEYQQIDELTEEEEEKGYLDGFVTEDGVSQITVRYQDFGEDVTYEDILESAEGQYDDAVTCVVNDIEMLLLSCDDGETVNVFINMTDGAFLQICYLDLDTTDRKVAAGFSQMSIQLLEEEE